MPERKDGSWVPQDVDRIAKEKTLEIVKLIASDRASPDRVKDFLVDLMMAERDNIAAMLKDPAAVRVNVQRGGIVLPDEYVRLHDTDGPVAEKVNKAVNAQIEADIGIFKAAIDRIFTEDVLPAKVIEDAVKEIRKQKRK